MDIWPKPVSEFPRDRVSNPFTLTHKGKQTLMLNAYERYKNCNGSLEMLECMYAFFDHAFHLKEWIKEFSGIKHFDELWKTKYGSNIYYKMCRDLCNKFKHFYITKPSVTSRISLVEKHYGLNTRPEFFAFFDDQYIPIQILMDEVVAFWDQFFRNQMI